MRKLPKLIVIVGPTASGKTDMALALARRYKGEVISADSRQFYRGMAIGAAVPDGVSATRRGVRAYWVDGIAHHLMSFRAPSQQVTVAQFQRMVARKVREITARGHVPFLVGGTGLYVGAVVDNFTIPQVKADAAVRRALERRETADLLAELRKKDPAYAARITPQNRRYITRALEVIHATGKPFSALQGRGVARYDVLQLGVTRTKAVLQRRIGQRVGLMMGKGLLEEARRLGKRHGWDLPVLSSLGHRQLGQFLRGESTLEEAVERIKRDTQRYAKRQMTWFRRDKRILWVRTVHQAALQVQRFLKISGFPGQAGE
jgi:tRNA dimethylallyltransferase